MVDFVMPSLGADMESGVLVEWAVKPGDTIERGQVVAVVETDKGAIDVEVFDEGVVEALLVEPDTRVPVGTVLATIRIEGEDASVAAQAPAGGPSSAATQVVSAPATSSGGTPPPREASSSASRPRMSPRARKLAASLGVDPSTLSGTGPGGSITGEDIERAAATRPEPSAKPTGMRGAIAAAMSRSKREIPHYYLGHTVDLEPALTWLEARNATRSVTERVLPIALLVRAVALAVREFPELCGRWEGDPVGGAFVPSADVHVGLAVSRRDGGLVNPALHNADQGTLVELFANIRDVTGRARKGQLRSSELSDVVLTVTSLGDRGVDEVYGVIHPPQVAIVGFGSIEARPWVVEGAVVPRRTVRLTLSADHRVSDGHRGARFLRLVQRHLQEPTET